MKTDDEVILILRFDLDKLRRYC